MTYEVVVTTGTKRGAGTDADVKIALFGALGKTDEILLDNDKDNFERGKVDHFLIDRISFFAIFIAFWRV